MGTRVSLVALARTMVIGMALWLTAACATHPAQYAFRNDFRCSTSDSRVAKVGRGVFHVEGCGGLEATYRCAHGRCVALNERRRRSAPKAEPRPVQREAHAEGYEVLKAELGPEREGLRVEAGAAPTRARDYVIVQFRLRGPKLEAAREQPCDLRLMVDLERVSLDGLSRSDGRDERVCGVKLPLSTADRLVSAQHVVWGVFGGTWDMDAEARTQLADLLRRHRDAIAGAELAKPAP